jgi:TolB-like protein
VEIETREELFVNIRWCNLLLVVGLFLALASGPAAGRSARKVLILPFSIHAEKDLTFLRNGIQDMLATRLTRPGEVSPMGREIGEQAAGEGVEFADSEAVALGRRLGADYVVFGSLTLFGNSVSTDARVAEVAAGKAVYTFNETGQNEGDIIAHVNRFAAEANRRVFGQAAPEGTAAPAAPAADPVEESRMHPEKLWTGGATEDRGGRRGRREEDAGDLAAPWRSQPLRLAIRGMAAGDVDGDGTPELVFVDQRAVHIYRLLEGRMLRVAEISSDANTRHLAVDVADINGNGRDEIFVTALFEAHRTLRSFVLEWDGEAFREIAARQPWYFRVVEDPLRGPVLVGQRRTADRTFVGGVDELQYDGNGFAAVLPRALPGWVTVFGFAYGDIAGDGRETVAAFGPKDQLRIVSREGETLWESREPYGRTVNFVEVPAEATSSIGDYRETDRRYLSARVLVADVNGDGRDEVIVSRNDDTAGNLFQKLRLLKGGHMTALTWDRIGMNTLWRTRETDGYISDHALYDTDGDGNRELIYAVVRQSESVVAAARSFVVIQKLHPSSR